MCVLLIKRLLRLVGRWARKPVNHTSWVAVVTPTDRPKSVRNRCLIELFCDVVCVATLPFWHFCWCRGFCHRTESDLFLFLLYSKSMKTQHFYFLYLSNMDLSIKILFSSDNCTLHILSKDHSLYWLIVNMHWLKVLVQKTSYLTPCYVPHVWFVFLHLAFLADWVDNIFPTSKCRYVFSISKYSKIKSEKNWTI